MTSTSGAYRATVQRRVRFSVLLALLTFVLLILDIRVGSSNLSFTEVLQSLLAGPSASGASGFILWEIRLPMSLTCLAAGFSLSLAGLLIQTITNNPLASPYTLGVTAGASFGAALSITFGFALFGQLWIGTSLAALTLALCVSTIVILLGKRRLDSTTLVLVGVVMNFFFQALQQYLQYRASPEIAQIISGWTFGNLQRASWVSAVTASICWLCCLMAVSTKVWEMTALSTGDERARSLGIRVDRLRIFVFSISSVLIASAVAFIGTVAFIGLIAPHCTKLLLGEDQRFLLPCASLMGASLMLAASILAKFLSEGATLPVGIITSVIGVPFLFALLMKSRSLN